MTDAEPAARADRPIAMSDRTAFLAAIAAADDDDAPNLVYADWLDERGEADMAESLRLQVKLRHMDGRGPEARADRKAVADRIAALNAGLSPLNAVTDPNAYDWREAFAYAGGGGCGEPNVKRAAPHIEVSEAPFGRDQVVEVIAARPGENDGPNWVCVGRLADGRWFALDAGCDYTGWD